MLSSAHREWRQFRLLLNASFGRLMDAAVGSRDIEATQFVIWAFALIASPVFFYAARMMGRYSFLIRQPELLARTVVADRLFFIVYAIIACALLAAVLWEALFPDRQDQEVVGVLPVRARTVAAARLTAALAAAGLFAVAMAIPSGVMYALAVATAFKSASIVGSGLAVFAAHVITMTAAGLCTFGSLLAVQAVAVLCVGTEIVQRAAVLLQLVTVVLLVEAFIFLPGVLMGLSASSAAQAWTMPPLWFLGLYSAMSGAAPTPIEGFAGVALAATLGSVCAAAAAYLPPARYNARRTVEARLRGRTRRSLARLEWMARPGLRSAASRAVFSFVLASLARSRRHLLIVTTYLGVGVSVAGLRLVRGVVYGRPVSFDAPAEYLLAVPLVLTFFLVLGLRAAFAVPTDADANWTFRLAPQPATAPCVHGVAAALLLLAVLPISLAWLIAAALMWSDLRLAAASSLMHAASGLMLVEAVLLRCEAVPFTREHAPASSSVRGGWALALVALVLFAFTLDGVQMAALSSPRGVALYVGVMLAAAAGARLYRRVKRLPRTLLFDAPAEPAAQALHLSEAAG